MGKGAFFSRRAAVGQIMFCVVHDRNHWPLHTPGHPGIVYEVAMDMKD